MTGSLQAKSLKTKGNNDSKDLYGFFYRILDAMWAFIEVFEVIIAFVFRSFVVIVITYFLKADFLSLWPVKLLKPSYAAYL